MTGSLYSEERVAFWKMITEYGHVDEDGDGGGPEPDGDGKAEDGPSRRGPPAGHAGIFHTNRADRPVVLRAYRCSTCGRGHLKKVPPAIKMVYDFAGGNSMAVECVAYVMKGGGYCKRCGNVTAATAPAVPETSFGPAILGFIEEYYAGRCTDQTIYFFEALYGFALSPNAVWNARRAIRTCWREHTGRSWTTYPRRRSCSWTSRPSG